MKLSKNLSLIECTKSATARRHGVDNTPKQEHITNLVEIAQNVFQPTRDYFNTPIYISSGYRSKRLNDIVKGSETSQHMIGEALDLDADVLGVVSNRLIFNYIKDNLEFDQLIWEFGDSSSPDWVHVSYSSEYNRNQVLKAVRTADGVKYTDITHI